jgi:hypothetical protein
MLIFNSSKALVRLYPDVGRLAGEVGVSPTLSRNGNGVKLLSPNACLSFSSRLPFASKGVERAQTIGFRTLRPA